MHCKFQFSLWSHVLLQLHIQSFFPWGWAWIFDSAGLTLIALLNLFALCSIWLSFKWTQILFPVVFWKPLLFLWDCSDQNVFVYGILVGRYTGSDNQNYLLYPMVWHQILFTWLNMHWKLRWFPIPWSTRNSTKINMIYICHFLITYKDVIACM